MCEWTPAVYPSSVDPHWVVLPLAIMNSAVITVHAPVLCKHRFQFSWQRLWRGITRPYTGPGVLRICFLAGEALIPVFMINTPRLSDGSTLLPSAPLSDLTCMCLPSGLSSLSVPSRLHFALSLPYFWGLWPGAQDPHGKSRLTGERGLAQ